MSGEHCLECQRPGLGTGENQIFSRYSQWWRGLEWGGGNNNGVGVPACHPANLISEQARYSKVMPGWTLLVGGCSSDKITTQSKWTVSQSVSQSVQGQSLGWLGVKSKEVSRPGPIIIVIISTSWNETQKQSWLAGHFLTGLAVMIRLNPLFRININMLNGYQICH